MINLKMVFSGFWKYNFPMTRSVRLLVVRSEPFPNLLRPCPLVVLIFAGLIYATKCENISCPPCSTVVGKAESYSRTCYL